MPRIRTLKPEHRQHRKVGRLSDRSYRLWVAMILEADDEGRLVEDLGALRLVAFGYHADVTESDVADALAEIENSTMIRRYLVEDSSNRYIWFPSWHDHQRIDRPRRSLLPPYSAVMTSSTNDRRTLVEPSTMARADRKDLIGSDRKDLTTSSGLPPDVASPNGHGPTKARPHRGEAAELLAFLNEKTGRHYRPVDTTLRLIEARLTSGATVANCRGVIARKVREWNTDPRMVKYLRPETLFNATKFESYLGERDGSV